MGRGGAPDVSTVGVNTAKVKAFRAPRLSSVQNVAPVTDAASGRAGMGARMVAMGGKGRSVLDGRTAEMQT